MFFEKHCEKKKAENQKIQRAKNSKIQKARHHRHESHKKEKNILHKVEEIKKKEQIKRNRLLRKVIDRHWIVSTPFEFEGSIFLQKTSITFLTSKNNFAWKFSIFQKVFLWVTV